MERSGRAVLAADIGGTFTDLVLEVLGPHGTIRTTAKVLTTPAAPEQGIMAGIRDLAARTGFDFATLDLFVHGTTLATNAIIERKGARTALVTSEGFRDTIEIGFENRFEQYDLRMEKPKPLVARPDRHTVRERVDAHGNVLAPLDPAELVALAARLRAAGIESVAIGFLHSYAYDAHERRARDILAAELPGVAITLSSEVCPEIREFERFTTACANAYVQPLMARYLNKLVVDLSAEGVACPILLMTSNGGLTTLETAARFPIRLVESGPAGGVIFAVDTAVHLGLDSLVSFDMGGTTAKLAMTEGTTPHISRSFEVDRRYRFLKGSGLPLRVPVIEMVEIGAGGGSIARIDAMGRVAVGPESAGAQPGPACYGQGGERPTVTDANLLLGRIDPANFARGSFALRPAAASAAVRDALGETLGLDVTMASHAISAMVEENMVNAARAHAVEHGLDFKGRTMVAFGGSAPLHAAQVAEKLGVTDVLIPAGAGVGSAIGFLRAPIAFQVVRSRMVRLSAFTAAGMADTFAAMLREATAVIHQATPEAQTHCRWTADMRYVGQGHELSVDIHVGPDGEADAVAIRALFEDAYARVFGRTIDGHDVEVITWTLIATSSEPVMPFIPPPAAAAARAPAEPVGQRHLWDEHVGGMLEVPVYNREDLAPGSRIAGPAVICELETTTIVTAGFDATLEVNGAIRLGRKDGVRTRQAASVEMGRLAHDVMWNRLIAVVEEQAQTLVRTAFGTPTREAGDLSAGVYDIAGRMLAQAITGTPGHVNSMARSVTHVLDRFPIARMMDGDVFITNDPWMGTGHLNDIVVTTPCFLDGKPVGLFACTLHVTDIGGVIEGGRQVYEEGIQIPIVRLVRAGEIDDTLMAMIAENVRQPIQVLGDIHAEIACNEMGCRRLRQMMTSFGLASLDGLAEHILTRSRDAMRARIAALPDGTWTNEMLVDSDGRATTLSAQLTVAGESIKLAITADRGVAQTGINVPACYTEAYCYFGLKAVLAPEIPNNVGSMDVVEITVAPDTILNAPRPSPVRARAMLGQLLPDAVMGCLAEIVPDAVPAESTSRLWSFRLYSATTGAAFGRHRGNALSFTVSSFHSGGTGAMSGKDGMSATAFPSGVRTMPVEVTESICPVVFRRKEFRMDSGGAGAARGGLGQVMELETTEDAPFTCHTSFDRIVNPARGRRGGLHGGQGRLSLRSGPLLPGRGSHLVEPGDRLVIEMPGGGGYGAPLARPADRVAADVRDELVSREVARHVYGVAIDDHGNLDIEETAALRASGRMS